MLECAKSKAHQATFREEREKKKTVRIRNAHPLHRLQQKIRGETDTRNY